MLGITIQYSLIYVNIICGPLILLFNYVYIYTYILFIQYCVLRDDF